LRHLVPYLRNLGARRFARFMAVASHASPAAERTKSEAICSPERFAELCAILDGWSERNQRELERRRAERRERGQ
jgi:hypothetical protein